MKSVAIDGHCGGWTVPMWHSQLEQKQCHALLSSLIVLGDREHYFASCTSNYATLSSKPGPANNVQSWPAQMPMYNIYTFISAFSFRFVSAWPLVV